MQLTLAPLATELFTRYLVAHAGHHLVHGPTRFADHAHLETLYHAYNNAFDRVAELAIARGEMFNHATVFKGASSWAAQLIQAQAEDIFATLSEQETNLRTTLDALLDKKPDTALATELQNLALESLQRTTHLRARIQ